MVMKILTVAGAEPGNTKPAASVLPLIPLIHFTSDKTLGLGLQSNRFVIVLASIVTAAVLVYLNIRMAVGWFASFRNSDSVIWKIVTLLPD